MPTEARKVTSLGSVKAELEPKPLTVSLEFTDAAAAELTDLMATLHAQDADSVALKAIALLASAKGKEILIRDPLTGLVSGVDL